MMETCLHSFNMKFDAAISSFQTINKYLFSEFLSVGFNLDSDVHFVKNILNLWIILFTCVIKQVILLETDYMNCTNDVIPVSEYDTVNFAFF